MDFSLVAASRGYPLVAVHGLLIVVASRCRAQALGIRTQRLWCTGLVVPRHVESSQTRDQTQVPCIGRQILNHWTTREVPYLELLKVFLTHVMSTS